MINIAGLIYNHCIALHKRYYRLYKKSLNANRLKIHLTKLKRTKKFSYMSKLGSQVVQDIAERIDRAYNLFWGNLKRKKKTSPPKFRKVRRYKSYKPRTGKSVGLDFGLKQFLTGSDGHNIKSPYFFMLNIKKIRKKCRNLSRKKEGSRNRNRARKELARSYRKMNNASGTLRSQRKDFHFKTARKLCEEYAVICIETLNIKGMSRRWGRKIHSLGFCNFVEILKYEAKKLGTQIIFVDRYFPSSQLLGGEPVYYGMQAQDTRKSARFADTRIPCLESWGVCQNA